MALLMVVCGIGVGMNNTRQADHRLVQLASFNVIATVDGDALLKCLAGLSVVCNQFGGSC